MSKEFFNDYFQYVGETEAPWSYHRWCILSCISAILGRNVYFPFGHSIVYPNMYVMLEGNPGTRKGTAMQPAKNLLRDIGFSKLAPDRLSAERFIIEMQLLNKEEEIDGISFENLNFQSPSEMFVMAGEFQDFIGTANINFIGLLTNLWDNLPQYSHPKIHGASSLVYAPTVNILGAVNQQSLAISMPAEAVGQGGTSRWVFVHGDPTGKQYTFPKPGPLIIRKKLGAKLKAIQELKGEIEISADARILLDRMYKEYTPIDDFRFTYYNTRRFDHLLKASIVHTAMDITLKMESCHVLHANTTLHNVEQRMTKAFGEFGKSKHSETSNKVVEFIKSNFVKMLKPATTRDIWKQISNDLNKWDDMIEILQGLTLAEKIQVKEIKGLRGYVPKQVISNGWKKELLCEDFLLPEELL